MAETQRSIAEKIDDFGRIGGSWFGGDYIAAGMNSIIPSAQALFNGKGMQGVSDVWKESIAAEKALTEQAKTSYLGQAGNVAGGGLAIASGWQALRAIGTSAIGALWNAKGISAAVSEGTQASGQTIAAANNIVSQGASKLTTGLAEAGKTAAGGIKDVPIHLAARSEHLTTAASHAQSAATLAAESKEIAAAVSGMGALAKISSDAANVAKAAQNHLAGLAERISVVTTAAKDANQLASTSGLAALKSPFVGLRDATLKAKEAAAAPFKAFVEAAPKYGEAALQRASEIPGVALNTAQAVLNSPSGAALAAVGAATLTGAKDTVVEAGIAAAEKLGITTAATEKQPAVKSAGATPRKVADYSGP